MKRLYFTLSLFLFSQLLQAQDHERELTIDVTKDQDDWYRSPWVWVIGAAIFILLLIALSRGKRDS